LPKRAILLKILYSGVVLVSQKYSNFTIYVTFILKQRKHFGTILAALVADSVAKRDFL